ARPARAVRSSRPVRVARRPNCASVPACPAATLRSIRRDDEDRRVLIRRAVLDGIVEGRIDLAFRRQRRPTVKTGGSLRTGVGELAIGSVTAVTAAQITAADAHRAGYPSRAALVRELARKEEGRIYRVELRLAGPDPRAVLRERADLDDADVAELDRRLARL